ncbi:hypothetical protein K491DRAFT_619527 [Lophiostoma macrostomum CBS 122681]|uniref:Nitrogen permease regulator 3 n=1 Tax=Lophiostoma macrostomum CBS 122681 TaxID=1314788 RepID=A0A6A6TQD2_9PLEO|nr:hypothetical protein K491DRAFT_619527 [Lophiostoma macrostomum CBS 122681]
MALPLPPSSNLHAVLLVTKSRSLGPRLVFHYPPLSPSAAALATNTAPTWFGNETSTGSIDSHSSSSDWDSSTETEGADDDIEIGSRTSGGRGSGRTASHRADSHRHKGLGAGGSAAGNAWGRQESIDEEDAGSTAEGKQKHRGVGGDRDWNTVLGFKVDALEKMLCPTKAFNKRRFELGVESCVFVGAPMFVREDGMWKKGRRRKRKEREVANGDLLAGLSLREEGNGVAHAEEDEKQGEGKSSAPPTRSVSTDSFEYPVGFEPGYGHGLMSGAASGAASEAGSDTRSNSTTENALDDMTMFNVVFVLNPPALEYQLRVKEMYDNVTRKYAKALKYEQARFQYVWRESKKVIGIKQRAKENGETLSGTWREIISVSPLAKSIAIMFDAISHEKIAHIHFDRTFSTSFQIPQRDSTPFLPNAMEPQMPGLWLTTSNVAIGDDLDAPMTQHAALLLLQDSEILVKEFEGDSKANAFLAFCIRNIVPTKSLQKIALKHNILGADMEYIASHLVYWRRARLIAPLHPRDTYIVSPNADMSALPSAIPTFAARFSTLPSLPKMLSMLSSTPRPYKTFIPTNEHREAYMDILAWLMRGGWVTQLRTFAWVRVTPEIKALVAQEMEREALATNPENVRRHPSDDSQSEIFFPDKRSSFLSGGRPSTPLRRPPRRDDEDSENNAILSPRAAYRGSPARPGSDAGSTSSNRTAIPLSAGRPTSPMHTQSKPHRPSPLHLKTTSPSRSSNPSLHAVLSPTSPSMPGQAQTHHRSPSPPLPAHLTPSHFRASLVLSPQKANAMEARWLEKIGASFDDDEVREHWPMLLRHLDGRHALEDMNTREGIKRKRVAGLVNGVRKEGWLVIVRHW